MPYSKASTFAHSAPPDQLWRTSSTCFCLPEWVRGSEKSDAVKCWHECNRIARNGEEYVQTNKDKFMENNPYWTDEMYDVKMDVVSDDYLI